MRKVFHLSCVTIVTILFTGFALAGCTAFSALKGGGPKSPSQEGDLYAKVPASMRAPVQEATFDLNQAQSNLNLAQKKVALADLLKEHGMLKKKHAENNKKLAQKLLQKAQVALERKKLEAIDNANLGKKTDNINKIASLRTKELGIESEAVRIQAEVDTMEINLQELDKKIDLQSTIISKHK